MADEIPGTQEYVEALTEVWFNAPTLLDKACEVPWKHEELFREEGKPAPLGNEGDQAEDV